MRFVWCQHFGTVLYQNCVGLLLIWNSMYENARFTTNNITMFAIQSNWNIDTEKKNSEPSRSAPKLCHNSHSQFKWNLVSFHPAIQFRNKFLNVCFKCLKHTIPFLVLIIFSLYKLSIISCASIIPFIKYKSKNQ